MNTITQIENALKAINQATFQSLITHILHLQGNKFIGAPGAVIGKEKTSKGTPDLFFATDDKYIFVECTTQGKLGKSKSFFEKLFKDIEHCFNQQESTIDKYKIESIILACNEKVSPEEYNQLKTKVQSYNPETKFDILNIQNLPFIIYDFSSLAEEYLNIKIVKGDIFTLDEFLVKTTKGIQPSLSNEFLGREEELKKSVEALRHKGILLLSGGGGVGKSKLAVKILEEFSKEGYTPVVIQSSAVPLWEDFNHYFIAQKNYIVLFDDANKSIHNLNYLLSIIDKPNSFTVKVIITSRDYVKKQVLSSLGNYSYEEIEISEFKDEEIEKIITKALPNLRYNSEIRRKIVELAKGNARIALMATYSVTHDSETNYLGNPVLLYEKYFKKISDEIGIFNSPIILKSLAIVSFFGVLDRNNEELKATLFVDFNIDWNELWSAIMELHGSEILNVYSNEVVKVSDQVLATYSFYKCFIDENSSVINYALWIRTFIGKYANRIKITLIDANNTFVYSHIKDLVLPHLSEVLRTTHSDKQLYTFYTLFWFYKDWECLVYLKNWINTIHQEQEPNVIKFTFVHNEHIRPTKYFELLKNFWSHKNELLKPSIELTLDLMVMQPSRIPEIQKFIHEDFSYIIADRDSGYFRQNVLLDVLLNENLPHNKKILAKGTLLNVLEVLLGWQYREFGSYKSGALTFINFDLYKSEALMKLRKRMLNEVYELFDTKGEQVQKILHKIVYPGGNIDEKIYIEELPIYEKLISKKLDNTQYTHCKFVKALVKHLSKADITYPINWNNFIESDIIKLSKFLKPGWEYRDDKSIDEFEKEKKEEFDKLIATDTWNNIEKLLVNIDNLYMQQTDDNWLIEGAITDIYVSIAKKGKDEFESALRLYFSGKVIFPLRTTILNFVLQNNIITGEVLVKIMHEHEFIGKPYWESVLLAKLPEQQVTDSFLKLLIKTFKNSDNNIYISSMFDYLKYERVFDVYKKNEEELVNHNIITYLTSVILTKPLKNRYTLGFNFCAECYPYFSNQINLFKEAYISLERIDENFDHNGKELEAVLKLDSNFFIEYLEQKSVNEKYLSFKLENTKLDCIWNLSNYEDIVEKALNIIIEKSRYSSNWNHPTEILFSLQNNSKEINDKALDFLEKYMDKNYSNIGRLLIVLNILIAKYKENFIGKLKKLLVINNDIEILRRFHFSKNGIYSGSRVPYIQDEIDLCKEVIEMVKRLPDLLTYSEHITYMEVKIQRLKKDIQNELRAEFEDEYSR